MKNEKIKYETPVIDIIEVYNADVITTSIKKTESELIQRAFETPIVN